MNILKLQKLFKLKWWRKAKVLEPTKYDIKTQNNNSAYLKSINNPLKIFQLLKVSVKANYSLQEFIPENVKIRN